MTRCQEPKLCQHKDSNSWIKLSQLKDSVPRIKPIPSCKNQTREIIILTSRIDSE